jgi:hypothetical protein
MPLFSRLFGGSSAPTSEPEPEIYKDFKIFAEPANEGGRFRVAARIEKEIDGEAKSHHMIRADTFDSADAAREASAAKARQLIDEQGVRQARSSTVDHGPPDPRRAAAPRRSMPDATGTAVHGSAQLRVNGSCHSVDGVKLLNESNDKCAFHA